MSSAAVQLKRSDQQALQATGPFTSPGKRTVVLSLLLVMATLFLYNPVTHFSFINYDDSRYVYENVHVRQGLTGATIRWAITSFDQANWHPLTWFSHALDCQLFHLNPAGHHFTSILLHALNGVLLFLLLARSTGKVGRSFFVALLFALHPMNVESVAWVAERKNVLSTFFFLLTLGAYVWYALNPGWRRYCAVAGLLACGLASKPMLVTTPFVLLLLDYWPLARFPNHSPVPSAVAAKQTSLSKLLLEKVPLLFMVAASSMITMRAQRAGGAFGLVDFPLLERVENAIYSYASYVWKAIWPARLALFYPHSGSLSLWRVSLAAIFLAAVSYLVWKLRSRGYLLVGWLWFLGTLVPVIGLVQVGDQAMADRYAYIPLIGIFVMAAWSAADAADSKKWPLAVQVIPAACIVLALSIVTHRQIGYWRDSVTVWTHTLQVTQHNNVAEDNLGEALVELGRPEEAYPLFLQAVRDNVRDPVARVNVGSYLYQNGHPAEAIQQYEQAVKLGAEPGILALAYANLGTAYSGIGEYGRAQASYEQALRLDPYHLAANQGMAIVLEKQGRLEDTIPYLVRVAEMQPSEQNYLQLARVLAVTNHPEQANAAYRQAVSLAQQSPARRPSQQLQGPGTAAPDKR